MTVNANLKKINIQDNEELINKIFFMHRDFKNKGKKFRWSKMWEELNNAGISYLKKYGFENFKRTVVRHYFANTPFWMLNQQILFLVLNISPLKTFEFFIKSLFTFSFKPFSRIDAESFSFISYLIWEYVDKNDKNGYLTQLKEPEIGNPPPLFIKNKLISQDLANSVLEYKSIFDETNNNKITTVMEIGSGSGRTAYVILRLNKNIKKYIFVDISPALALAEKYISYVFNDKKIFKYRDFNNFKDIEKEFNSSELIFLLPHQILMLPKGIIDLTINISSFHEMLHKQIALYFKEIERLTKRNGYLYIKEWKKGVISQDNVIIYMKDYPISSKWKSIYRRTSKVQIKFFEQLLQLK